MQSQYQSHQQYAVSDFHTQQSQQARHNAYQSANQEQAYRDQQQQEYPYIADSQQQQNQVIQNEIQQSDHEKYIRGPFAQKINSLASQMKQLVRSAQLDLARKNQANTQRYNKINSQYKQTNKFHFKEGQQPSKKDYKMLIYDQSQAQSESKHKISVKTQEAQKWRKLYYQQLQKTNKLFEENKSLNQQLFSYQQELECLQLKFNKKVNQIAKGCVSEEQYYSLRDAFDQKCRQSDDHRKKYEDFRRKVQNIERQYRVKEERIRTKELQYIAKQKALDEREQEIIKQWTAVQKVRQQNILKENSIAKKELDIQRHLQWMADKQAQIKGVMSRNPTRNYKHSSQLEAKLSVKPSESQSKIFDHLFRQSNVEKKSYFNNLGRENQEQDLFRSKSNQNMNKKPTVYKKTFQKNNDSSKQYVQSPSNNSLGVANINNFKVQNSKNFFIPVSSPTKQVAQTDYPQNVSSVNFTGQRMHTFRVQTNRQGKTLGTQNSKGNLATIESKLQKLRRQIRKQISAMD